MEGKGEGERGEKEERASCVLDISDGHWVTHCRSGSVMSFDGNFASKRYCFQLKNSTFHLSRTFFLEGPNSVKNFPHFINITFSAKKRQGLFT